MQDTTAAAIAGYHRGCHCRIPPRQPSQDTTAGCHCRLPPQAAIAGYHRRLPLQATTAGCHRRIPKQAAIAGYHHRLPSQDTIAGCKDTKKYFPKPQNTSSEQKHENTFIVNILLLIVAYDWNNKYRDSLLNFTIIRSDINFLEWIKLLTLNIQAI